MTSDEREQMIEILAMREGYGKQLYERMDNSTLLDRYQTKVLDDHGEGEPA